MGSSTEGPGFSAGSVWTAQFTLAGPRYAQSEAWPRFESEALAALRALPGVGAAGFTSVLPFGNDSDFGSTVIDGYVMPEGGAPPHAQHRSIDEGYLAVLGVPIIAGRNFAAHESERVVIVDENLAAKYWPGRSALGQRLRHVVHAPDQWATIVGVVPAIKEASLVQTPVKETIYWHYEQRPRAGGVFTLRTVVPPAQVAGAVTAAVAALDPDVALFGAQSMDERVSTSLGPQRAPMVLTLVFAAVAFLLAVIGLYGVLAWAVSQRVGEIGVRMALGARAADIGRMILQQGGRLVAIGLVVGVAGSLALGRVLASQLDRVGAFDPVVLALTVVGLGGAALFASWLPARRAARIDPLEALRKE